MPHGNKKRRLSADGRKRVINQRSPEVEKSRRNDPTSKRLTAYQRFLAAQLQTT